MVVVTVTVTAVATGRETMNSYPCDRCGKILEGKDYRERESFRVASKHKATTYILCVECFNAARQAIMEWKKNVNKKS